MLIDFNYETEPLPGHYPSSVGAPLLEESRVNHLGKLLFQQLYWHALLPGRDLPGVSAAMPRRGKDLRLGPGDAPSARSEVAAEPDRPEEEPP